MSVQRVPLLGAVGPLQFEVVQHRLLSEYAAESRLENAPWQYIRWIRRKDGAPVVENEILPPSETSFARDADGNSILLLSSTWPLRFFADRNPQFELLETPPA